MKILSDSRQVPKKEELIKNKNYLDLLWGYLQVNSDSKKDKEDKIQYRYVVKKRYNFSYIGESLNISRQTIKKKFDFLVSIGMISDGGDIWILNNMDKQDAFLIENNTLRKLVSFTNERVISIYTYILNRFYATEGNSFILSITGLKDKLGLSVATCSNNYIITDILECLQRIGLIKYEQQAVRKESGQLIKQYMIIDAVNSLSEC